MDSGTELSITAVGFGLGADRSLGAPGSEPGTRAVKSGLDSEEL